MRPKDIYWREFDEVESLSPTKVRLRGKDAVTQVCSTQYLSIPWLAPSCASSENLSPLECCSFGSPFLGGMHPLIRKFEEGISSHCGTERALTYTSGWSAAFSVGEWIGRVSTAVVADHRVHNSVRRGLQCSGVEVDYVDLSEQSVRVFLDASVRSGLTGILSSSVDGLSGKLTSLEVPADIADRILWACDESHSIGIGPNGFGCVSGNPDLRFFSLSKGFGGFGGAVVGSSLLIEDLAQFGSPWTFSSVLPQGIVRGNISNIGIVKELDDARRSIIDRNCGFRQDVRAAGIRCDGDLHISSLHLKCDDRADLVERRFLDAGFYLKVARFPSRPKGEASIRICLNHFHDSCEVEALLRAVRGDPISRELLEV